MNSNSYGCGAQAVTLLGALLLQGSPPALGAGAAPSAANAATCHLNSDIRAVVYLQFDNVHFSRDNAKVPSDLERQGADRRADASG
jgi:hypothetical protein